jgi:hypothetical protein
MAKTLTSDETLSFIWALAEQDSTGTAWWADGPVRVPVQKALRQLAVEWSEHKFKVPVRSTLQDARQQLKKNADMALNAVKSSPEERSLEFSTQAGIWAASSIGWRGKLSQLDFVIMSPFLLSTGIPKLTVNFSRSGASCSHHGESNGHVP